MISLCCAAQYYRREGADKQLWINGKVLHGHLTPVPLPKFHPRSILFGHGVLPPPSKTSTEPAPKL
jgi:hypothetical protein